MKLQNRIRLVLAIILLFCNYGYSQSCNWTVYNTNNSGLPVDFVNDIELDYEGNLWIATYSGLVVFNGDTSWFTHDTTTGLIEQSFSMLEIDYDGNIWGGSISGAYRYKNNTWNMFNSQNSILLGDDIIDIEADMYGGLWFSAGTGVKSGGVTYFDGNTNWATFSTTDGLISNDIIDIAIDNNDNIWFASANYLDTGITTYNGINWITYQYADTIPLVNIRKIIADLDGNIWILSDSFSGAIKFNNLNSEYFNETNSPLIGHVQCVEMDYNGNIWFGTTNGAFKYDGVSWQTFNITNSGLPENSIIDIAIDLNGNVWFATSYMGVARLNVNAELLVYVKYAGNILNFNDVSLGLYSSTYQASDGSDSLVAIIDSSIQMSFIFENIKHGNYYVKAAVKSGTTYSDMVNSYYALNDTVYMWQDASIVSLSECDWQDILLNMYSYPINMNAGNGIFSGKISYNNGNAKIAGEPVSGAEIFIKQEPNNLPVVSQKTDTTGNFIFYGIPTGNTFKIYVDIPGLPMIETYSNLEITSTELIVDSLDFLVDTSGIFVNENTGFIKLNNQLAFNIYPNPFTEKLNIEYNLLSTTDVKIVIINENGRLINTVCNNRQPAGKYLFAFTGKDISNGIYYIYITLDNKSYLKKLIFTK